MCFSQLHTHSATLYSIDRGSLPSRAVDCCRVVSSRHSFLESHTLYRISQIHSRSGYESNKRTRASATSAYAETQAEVDCQRNGDIKQTRSQTRSHDERKRDGNELEVG